MLHGGSFLSDSSPPTTLDWRHPSVPPLRITSRQQPICAAFVPAIPEHSPPAQLVSRKDTAQSNRGGAVRSTDGAGTVRDKEWRVYAQEHWRKEDETALIKDEPLPLQITFPGSTPVPEEVEKMKNCDPEIKDCRDVMYQWTGKCIRCQGTGEVSFYRKNGREVIIKCIACLGFGCVQKITTRTDIDVMEDLDGAP